MDSGNEYIWNGGVDTVSTDPAIHVNTLPSLSDDAAVTGSSAGNYESTSGRSI